MNQRIYNRIKFPDIVTVTYVSRLELLGIL